MTATPQAPADVRDMGIIHSALRRDLERTRIVLGGTEPISDERRTALAQHLLWLLHFLHVHHTDEDTGLWPEVKRRNPDAAALTEVMEADHRRIGPGMTALEADAGREHMLAKVPRPMQILLDLFFARGHWRRMQRLWGGTPAADVPSLSLAYLDQTSA